MPVDLICSGDMTAEAGYNLTTADSSTMVYTFFNGGGGRVCDFSVLGAREDILNTSMIRIPNLLDLCPGLTSGQYVMQMHVNALAPSILMAIQVWNFQKWTGYPVVVTATVGADRSVQLYSPDLSDAESGGWAAGGWAGPLGNRSAKVVVSQVPYDRCTYSASPLVIQLEHAGPIKLTPPLAGIQYDILGVNANPPHAPQKISWFTAESAIKNYFVVLPDERGEVTGIDQLFGDNTTGPDGKTPAHDPDRKLRNGYEALRKWDGRRQDGSYVDALRDGYITPRDPIFERLRLWLDDNHDGIAQPNELTTLASHDVVSIDLNYLRDFVETDDYGNSTRMKSVAKTGDGKLHLMYDLWFRALDPSVARPPLIAKATGRSTVTPVPVGREVASATPAVTLPAPDASRTAALSLTALAFVILALALIFVP